MELLIINWIFGGLGALVGLLGVFFIFSAVGRLGGGLKSSMMLLAISMVVLVGFGLSMGYIVSGCQGIDHAKNIWAPIALLIGTSLFALGSKKLLNVLNIIKL